MAHNSEITDPVGPLLSPQAYNTSNDDAPSRKEATWLITASTSAASGGAALQVSGPEATAQQGALRLDDDTR